MTSLEYEIEFTDPPYLLEEASNKIMERSKGMVEERGPSVFTSPLTRRVRAGWGRVGGLPQLAKAGRCTQGWIADPLVS